MIPLGNINYKENFMQIVTVYSSCKLLIKFISKVCFSSVSDKYENHDRSTMFKHICPSVLNHMNNCILSGYQAYISRRIVMKFVLKIYFSNW